MYSEADLQHASFWCKERVQQEQWKQLEQFQEVWRSVSEYMLIQQYTFHISTNLHEYICFYICRYTLSHLYMKCRRKAILEYFKEPTEDAEILGQCCDVCVEPVTETEDFQDEMTALLSAAQQIPDKGEKKVRILRVLPIQ